MDLTKIIAITGKPGLFELVSQAKGGFIVKDLTSQKKLSINSNSQVSLLQNISIYTQDSEVPLVTVLITISAKHDYKEIDFNKSDSQKLRALMEEVQPDYAADRVYDSDLKKLFSWYNILVKNKIITEKSVATYQENLAKAKEEMEKAEAQKEITAETSEEKTSKPAKATKKKIEKDDKDSIEENKTAKTTKAASKKKTDK
ncbi:DUF5606 domain-containing protein [Apibacter raozihei]|uniref:DUF5606 family protein n=1 Tax=Apibacter TaxID=1778601 RepID=UPI000FE404F2|nr:MULTISPECIES: DUF5606 domain-containing protein [Apibacter]